MTQNTKQWEGTEKSICNTSHPIPISIDQIPFKVRTPQITGEKLRALPEPDVPVDRDLWLEIPGPKDDVLITSDKLVELKPGMHFYTAPTTINPGENVFHFPQKDQQFLKERGYDWSIYPAGTMESCLVIRNFRVENGGFVPETTDLMLRIPSQYNLAGLDMWYCDPPIRIASTGQFAPNSEAKVPYIGRTWQRFSRHLPANAWRPGLDSLRSYMPHIFRELQGHRGG